MQFFHEKFYKRNKFCELFYIIYGYIYVRRFTTGEYIMSDRKLLKKVRDGDKEALSDIAATILLR